MTKKEQLQQELEENKKALINMLTKENGGLREVYTQVNHVSASGMTRHISCYISIDDQITDITWYVSKILDYKRSNKNGGLVVGGCGMDMGFHVVYSLSRKLFQKEMKDDGNTGDAGYKLKQRWL